MNRITQLSGLPTRLHQQLRKLIETYGADNGRHTITELGITTTQVAKEAETARLWGIFRDFGIVPLGNSRSFSFFGAKVRRSP